MRNFRSKRADSRPWGRCAAVSYTHLASDEITNSAVIGDKEISLPELTVEADADSSGDTGDVYKRQILHSVGNRRKL